jgi:hypothetical protein
MELFLCGGKSGVESRKELRQILGEFEGESDDERERLDWVLRHISAAVSIWSSKAIIGV